jgi:hypothetical protein
MRQPFAPADSQHASLSILRQRRRAVIPAPLLQHGPISCKEVAEFSYSEIAVAYLPNAVVTRTGAVIFQDKYIIEETLEGSAEANGLAADLTAEQLAKCPCSNEVVINCNKLGMWNYSLFLFEVAPAIMLTSFLPGLEDVRVKLFFQRFMQAQDIANRRAVFDLFGVGQDRILLAETDFQRHRGVIVFKINDPHRSQRLSQLVSPVCAVLREAFAFSNSAMPRRLYISRQSANSRRVGNYDALRDQILAKHRLVPLELERMTVRDQVDIFSKADLVLAEHGAGLANIAFMRPGGFVVEIMPAPIATRAVYRYLAAHARLNYIYATLPTPEGWRWDKDDVTAPLQDYDVLLSKIA